MIYLSEKKIKQVYRIPEEIKSRIPDYFYFAMTGELFSSFGYYNSIQMFTDTSEFNGLHNLGATSQGWFVAFMMTCKKLDMLWLLDYYKSLEWYDSDIFDSEIEDEIEARFINGKKNDHANCYYRYLCGVQKTMEEEKC